MKKLFLALIIVAWASSLSAATYNLALDSNGSVATQSSTASGRAASLAIDDNTNGDYSGGSVTHTANENDAWWLVDLGGTYDIEQIDLWNRTDSDVGSRLHHFTLSILDSTSSSVWSTYYAGPAGEHEIFGAIGSGPLASGQFVKIQFDDTYTTDRYLHIAEVQVWGDVAPVIGDVNNDTSVDLTDTILAIQVVGSLQPQGIVSAGDANGDQRTGLEEAIYALQVVAELKPDNDGDGFSEKQGDCNESDPDINPDAAEICSDDKDNNCNDEIDEGCNETVTTPAGQNVAITALGFDLLFDSVTGGGETTVEVLPAVPEPPLGFRFAGTYHDVSTTALFTGSVEICINYDDTGLNAEEEAGLQIFHYNEGTSVWENITTIPVDTGINRICGATTGFSPVALGFSSIVGSWTVWMDYYCNGGDYTLTWIFSDTDMLPDYPGITNYRSVQTNGQIGYGTWAWNSFGVSYIVTVGFGDFHIPGNINGNAIAGSYTGTGGVPVCYSGVR